MQQQNVITLLDLIDLAHSLRQEQLFITNEQHIFARLNDSLSIDSRNVFQQSWICAQQRQNLSNLIVSNPDTAPSVCCQRANLLENTKFLDVQKAKSVKHQHIYAYIDLINYLHRSPYLLAQCLAIGDRIEAITPAQMNSIIQTIANGLYGNTIHAKDIELMLKLLQELIEIEIVPSENPRRMLRAGSSAFARLYNRFHESSFSAKLFLTALLHEPIMFVLIEDEYSLDIDPYKMLVEMTKQEKSKRFGQEGTAEYELNIRQYRQDIMESLFKLANRFVVSLQLNWMLFPSTLRWLAQTMCVLLKQAQLDEKIIYEMLTDMIFTHFICPAIVSPDLYGICDAPISEVARFNLIQIGQILQMLAVSKHRKVDAKLNDLYERFNKTVITGLLEQLMMATDDVDYEMDGLGILALSPHQNNLSRNLVFATQSELNVFVDFLRQVLENDGLIISGEDRRKLGSFLDQLPDKLENILSNGESLHNTENMVSPSTSKKQSIINLGKSTKSRLAKSISLNVTTSINNLIDFDDGSANGANGNSHFDNHINNNNNNNNNNCEEHEQVLVIPLTIVDDNKFQLLTEDEVVNMTNLHLATGAAVSNDIVIKDEVLTEKNVEELDRRNEENEALDGADRILGHGRQKHASFSLTLDDASIGNTSDNLEAVSEAPSNHSVASSLELEENDQNDNDNLSDMVSANVSGRGTPNISGRDTPSSQVTEGGGDINPIPTPQMAKILIKTRSDIEDKFYKFEIKKAMEGDETVSIISDTWSTDVLASDSETVEANDRNFSTPLIPAAVILPGDHNFDALAGTGRRGGSGSGSSNLRASNILDLSETQSESAWSTDVLASDSEKMNEIDTDDNQSVTARSDITDSAGRERYYASTRTTTDSSFFAPRPRWKVLFPANRAPDSATRNMDDSSRANLIRDAGGPHLSSTSMVNRANIQFNAISVTQTTRNFNPAPTTSTAHYERTFLSTTASTQRPPPLRQNSNESFTSNHSSLNDEKFNSPSRGGAAGPSRAAAVICNGIGVVETRRFKEYIDMPQTLSIFPGSNEPLEEYTDEQKANNDEFDNFIALRENNQSPNTVDDENVIKTTTHIINPFEDEPAIVDEGELVAPPATSNGIIHLENILGEEVKVEHRRLSQEQRNANFDSRRNGMSDMLTRINSTSTTSSLIRFSDASTAPSSSSSSSLPALVEITGGSVDLLTSDSQYLTDDYKNQAAAAVKEATKAAAAQNLISVDTPPDTLLIDKTKNLNISTAEVGCNGGASTSNHTNGGNHLLASTPTTKSGKHTGAIPKSISFDSSADKNGSNGGAGRRGDGRTNSGFFNKIKQGFKNRRNVKSRHSSDLDNQAAAPNEVLSLNSTGSRIHYNHQNGNLNFIQKNAPAPQNGGIVETSEDILAKYRRKASTSSDAATSDSTGSNNSSSIKTKSSHSEHEPRLLNGISSAAEGKSSFIMAKRKLRLVLSASDLYTPDFRHNIPKTASPLLVYLQIQLAQALNHQNFQQISYVSEAMRCLTSFDMTLHVKLFHELQQDLINRQNYLQYLIRYRQYLLSSVDNIERFRERLLNERDMCNRYLIMVCVRIFLEKREQNILKFQTEFTQLTVVDEKIDLLNEFMKQLMDELKGDGILYGMVDWQLGEARVCIERLLLQRLYRHVMFPNHDGDISRDHVLREHIRKLSRVTRPSHPLLRIPSAYLNEEPWTFAQQQLLYISAYKTPREKVQCVVRCITSLMNLLSMASDRVPAADDLTPVLIYVIIKANPPYLLSTIEYVNCFIADQLEGESQYWWCQFCSAVTFIKTMDYGD